MSSAYAGGSQNLKDLTISRLYKSRLVDTSARSEWAERPAQTTRSWSSHKTVGGNHFNSFRPAPFLGGGAEIGEPLG